MASQTDITINQILELFKYLKSTSSEHSSNTHRYKDKQKDKDRDRPRDKEKDYSTLSVSSKNYQSISQCHNKNVLDSIFSDGYIHAIGNSNGNVLSQVCCRNGNGASYQNSHGGSQQQSNSYMNSHFSTHNDHNSNRANPTKKINPNSNIMPKKSHSNIFNKLYEDGKSSQIRKCLLQYETRKSIEEKQRSQCTFSPNIRSRKRVQTDVQGQGFVNRYSSVQNNQEFYKKNIQWVQRKEKNIKKLQIQKNQQHANQFTFTPKINKKGCGFKKSHNQNRENEEIITKGSVQKLNKNKVISVVNSKGVSVFLQRQDKAQKNTQYVKNKEKNPYSHVWNVKRGHFSYIK